MKVFISYSHQQDEWVLDRLAPVLECAGVEILIDQRNVGAGKDIGRQVLGSQDQADKQILVFSPDYFKSDWCIPEMNHALEINKQTGQELIIPVIRVSCESPEPLKNTRHVNLIDDGSEDEWKKLLDACEADLKIPAPYWLQKRDELRDVLGQDQSVNLVLDSKFNWRALLKHLKNPYITKNKIPDFKSVDLNSGAADTRRNLVKCIVNTFGGTPDFKEDGELAFLDRFFKGKHGWCRLEFQHMDTIKSKDDFDVKLFNALCHLVDERALLLFMISRDSLLNLLPNTDPRFNQVSSLATRCKMVKF